MTCVPGAPIGSPGDSHGSGKPFPGRERQPRHRKSENPDNSGSSLPAERNCRSSQHLSLPESIRPEHPPKTRAESPTSQAARGCVMTSKAVRRRQHALVLCRAQSLGAAIKLTDMREITHYVWLHPGEERYAATGSTGGALIVARRCSNTARVSLRLSRRAASVMASKGYVTSERSNRGHCAACRSSRG
jgi:hypothetical protein